MIWFTDGWTRDQVAVKADKIKQQLAYPEIGTTVAITPTHVVNVELLFAHIPELNDDLNVNLTEFVMQMNSPENETTLRPMKKMPGI